MAIKLRICKTCPIRHYENCNICAGFGVAREEILILDNGKMTEKAHYIEGKLNYIMASEAYEKTYPSNWEPCPECKSGPMGIPL